ncbi:MAG: Crp/Fnr family transcriptional regulator, partial [Chloroflexi bacterium]|nr:Crp/Fnr family transcriptional regulator [Chloroflexota bacterium]
AGNPRVLVTFSAGEVYGATAAVLGFPHTGTATAVVDSEVIAIRKDTFDRLCRCRPELIREILRELYETVCRTEQTIVGLTMKQVGPRIAAFLVKAAEEAAGPGAEPFGFDLTLSHQDLALLLGTTRETVTRFLTRLSRTKIISISGRRVFVLRPDALREFTQSR